MSIDIEQLAKQVRDMQDAMYRHGFMAAPPAIKITRSDSRVQAFMGQDGGSDFKLEAFNGDEENATITVADTKTGYADTQTFVVSCGVNKHDIMFKAAPHGTVLDSFVAKRRGHTIRVAMKALSVHAQPGTSFHPCFARGELSVPELIASDKPTGLEITAELATARNTIDALRYAHRQNAENAAKLMVHDQQMTCERDALKAQLEHLMKNCTAVNLDDAIKAAYYEDLLKRYINHVRSCEGVDFIDTGHHHNDDSFNAGEWAKLMELAKWVRP